MAKDLFIQPHKVFNRLRMENDNIFKYLEEKGVKDFVIAGGYVCNKLFYEYHGRDYYLGGKQDVDIFIFNDKYDPLANKLREEYFKEKSWNKDEMTVFLKNENVDYGDVLDLYTHNFEIPDIRKISFINAGECKDPKDVLSSFDLSVSMCGFDNENSYYHMHALSDIGNRQFRVLNAQSFPRTLNRIAKYTRYQFDYNPIGFSAIVAKKIIKNPNYLNFEDEKRAAYIERLKAEIQPDNPEFKKSIMSHKIDMWDY